MTIRYWDIKTKRQKREKEFRNKKERNRMLDTKKYCLWQKKREWWIQKVNWKLKYGKTERKEDIIKKIYRKRGKKRGEKRK